jgi:transposase
MEVLHPCCAGLDVHKETVVACVRHAQGAKVRRELRTFGTVTRELLALRDWLEARAVTHVALESTGVYWKPVWHVLEDLCTLVLANAQEIRNVPGRKSDMNDATWIADLLAHGLIRASFVPPTPIQELRDLTRTRKQLVRERSQHVQRLQKVLEDANVKLASVVSDIVGQSGRAVLDALVGGETDPDHLAALTHRLKASPDALRAALEGRVTSHHRFLLRLHLAQFDAAERAIGTVEARTAERLAPFRGAVERLCTIPGVSATTAAVLVAEIGVDMQHFPTAGHLVSWAGLCPQLDESAGKRRTTRLRRGNGWLKPSLVQAAWAAVKCRDSYLHAQFHRVRARRGAKKAIGAVAASMLTAAYHLLARELTWQDLGADYFARHQHDRLTRRLVHRLTQLGYHVELREAA